MIPERIFVNSSFNASDAVPRYDFSSPSNRSNEWIFHKNLKNIEHPVWSLVAEFQALVWAVLDSSRKLIWQRAMKVSLLWLCLRLFLPYVLCNNYTNHKVWEFEHVADRFCLVRWCSIFISAKDCATRQPIRKLAALQSWSFFDGVKRHEVHWSDTWPQTFGINFLGAALWRYLTVFRGVWR